MSEVAFRELHKFAGEHVSTAEIVVDIFSPFISRDPLEKSLLRLPKGVRVNVVTRWQMLDFVLGSASLDLYELCTSLGWTLYINPRLHLKTIVRDSQSVVLGSANITSRGLGLHPLSNHEVLNYIENPSSSYLLYLEQIKSESVLVTKSIVDQFRQALDDLEIQFPIDYDQLSSVDEALHQSAIQRDFFLTSELPLCQDIKSLYQVTVNPDVNLDSEILATARHDIVKYSLLSQSYQSEADFRTFLTQKFFAHPFIQAVCRFIDRPRRFGEMRAWVQEHCTDVPVPTRRDLSDNINVLYDWLVELGPDRFYTYRPNHSEIIAPISYKESCLR